MVKKKRSKFTSKKVVIPAVAVAFVVLVVSFPTLVAILEVNPFYNKDNFGVPELSIQELQNNDDIQKMIDETLNNQLCALSPAELDEIEQCEELVKDEKFVDVDPDDVDPSLIISCGLTQSQFDECTSEISEIIKNLQSQLIESQTPINDTKFSDDSPGEQVCDLTECPEANAVSLEANIVKVTSNQTRIESTILFDLPLQSIFVQDTSNIDFRNGFIEIELVAVTDPNVRLSGSGELDILVGGVSVLPEPFFISVQTENNTDGRVQLLIGGTERISLSLANLFNLFADRSVTPIELKIIDIEFTDERNIFQKSDFVIFSLNIFRDDVLILIQDEEGNTVRSFPMDSRVVIHSSASRSDPYQVCRIRVDVFQSFFLGNGLGCTGHTLTQTSTNDCSSATKQTVQVPAPTITASISDSEGNLLFSDSGSGNSLFDYDMLTRNATYTLSISQIGSGELDYGEAQETKSFTCTQEGTANISTIHTISGSVKPCSTYYRIATTVLNTANPLTLGSKTCNFP